MELIEGVAAIEDVDRFVEQLGKIGAEYGCVVTAFDARYLVGREHVAQAARLAKRAFRRSENVADDRSIEILLYAAGRRQIDRALEMGVSAGEGPIVVRVEHAGSDWERGDRAEAEDDSNTDDAGNVGTEDTRNRDGTEDAGENENGEGDAERRERAATVAVKGILSPGFEPADTLETYDEELVRDFFEIGDAELTATGAGLAALVGERVALLDVEK